MAADGRAGKPHERHLGTCPPRAGSVRTLPGPRREPPRRAPPASTAPRQVRNDVRLAGMGNGCALRPVLPCPSRAARTAGPALAAEPRRAPDERPVRPVPVAVADPLRAPVRGRLRSHWPLPSLHRRRPRDALRAADADRRPADRADESAAGTAAGWRPQGVRAASKAVLLTADLLHALGRGKPRASCAGNHRSSDERARCHAQSRARRGHGLEDSVYERRFAHRIQGPAVR